MAIKGFKGRTVLEESKENVLKELIAESTTDTVLIRKYTSKDFKPILVVCGNSRISHEHCLAHSNYNFLDDAFEP